MQAVITVENISKQYAIGRKQEESFPTLRDEIGSFFRRAKGLFNRTHHQPPGSPEEFWALKDVSFQVCQGDRIGIIGRNGAGKSTLLKILSRITEPTSGRIRLRGRVASLLEVGTGFHPELTGRENIFLNGSVLGMAREEIKKKFDEIVSFAEVEQFLDTPVKRYSSGMYMRLAFAVAAHLDPEILIVDEVLAVGDMAFKKKCIGKMNEVGDSGRTIIFVSHDMSQINSLCNKALILDGGKIVETGDVNTLTAKYIKEFSGLSVVGNPNRRLHGTGSYAIGPKIEEVALCDRNGNLKSRFSSSETFQINLKVKPCVGSGKPFAAIWFLHNEEGVQIAVGASFPMDTLLYPQHVTKLTCDIDPISLVPGTYWFRFVFHIANVEMFDDWQNAISFEITNSDNKGAGFSYPGIWCARQYVQHEWKQPT